MKSSELKKFLQIYFKRARQASFEAEKKEFKMLWRAIRKKLKQDKEAKTKKAALPAKAEKPKKDKKLEYDEDDE